MSWERFKSHFPDGVDTNFGFLTAEMLQQQDIINVVTVFIYETADNMIVNEQLYIYGKDNEFAIGEEYNINNEIQHIDNTCSLNVYGIAMLKDFLHYNYIPKDIKEAI